MLKKLSIGVATLLLALLPLGGRAAAEVLPNVIANPSVETEASALSPANWTPSAWGTNDAAFSYEQTGHTGNRSVKAAITTYTDGDAKWYFDAVTVTPGATYNYSNWYQSNVDTEVDAQVTDTNGVISYHYVSTALASPSAWAQTSGQFTAPVNAQSVTFYQVLNKAGFVQVDDTSLAQYTPDAFSHGMVSLTFDDTWRSQYTNGLPLLDQYGVKATFYALTGTFDYPDYMEPAMLQALQADGQEIASHTVTHAHLPTLTVPQMDQELGDAKTTLQSLLGTSAAQNFATPYGEYNSTVISEIQKYYRSHRSTDEGFNSKDNFDIYNIKVQNILDTTTPAQVAAWVAQAQNDKTWLVLVYHQVQDDPTVNAEDYSITPANLASELANIQQSGIAVKTVNQALDEIAAQLGTQTPPPAPQPQPGSGGGTVDPGAEQPNQPAAQGNTTSGDSVVTTAVVATPTTTPVIANTTAAVHTTGNDSTAADDGSIGADNNDSTDAKTLSTSASKDNDNDKAKASKKASTTNNAGWIAGGIAALLLAAGASLWTKRNIKPVVSAKPVATSAKHHSTPKKHKNR
ncbi:MAG TPA: polysaccharide deacetylase family protein [Nevskiaceae bacterium]|nr:polysaccharide deacetylase family protein [Nevskiaceae bacterium]